MGELDGAWQVERAGGALPPLVGVTKRIHGTRGETRIGSVAGVPFEVRGRSLHYRAPFAFCVDVLERRGDGFTGRATVFGREIGQFTMRRLEVADELEAQLIKHIDEAHAMEQNVLRMLDGMIRTTDDPEILDQLEQHKLETQRHADTMEQRLEAHDATPSLVKEAGGILGALMKLPLDLARGEKAGRNARDAFSTEHMEIASYELLKRVAQKAGDEETARACDTIIREERAMAAKISNNWDRVVELTLQQEGIAV